MSDIRPGDIITVVYMPWHNSTGRITCTGMFIDYDIYDSDIVRKIFVTAACRSSRPTMQITNFRVDDWHIQMTDE